MSTDSDPEDIIQFSQRFFVKEESPVDKAADIVDEIVEPIENIEEEGEKVYTHFKNEIYYIV